MIKEKIEKTRALLLTKKEEAGTQNIKNLFAFLVILIITVIAINTIWNGDEKKENSKESNNVELALKTTQTNSENVDNSLEEKLKNILQKIDGVGKVDVLITYSQTSELIAMFNESTTESSTQEDDSEWWYTKNYASRHKQANCL